SAATAGGIIRWIKPPAFYAPFALFNKAAGTVAFPLLAGLAIWGAMSAWRRGLRDAVAFAALWMWAPPILMMIASYALTPIFVERYALTCFVPFFILTSLGIFDLRQRTLRAAALAIAVAFSIGHILSYYEKPHDAQYREAVGIAAAQIRPGQVIT